MKKYEKLFVDINFAYFSEQTVLKIFINSARLADWCLGLCLLKEKLVENIICYQQLKIKSLELQLLNDSDIRTKPQVIFEKERVILRLRINDIEYLLHFFLKYYRDNIAEVDHLDLEASFEGRNEGEFYITFKVPNAVPPLSEFEARKRLDLEF